MTRRSFLSLFTSIAVLPILACSSKTVDWVKERCGPKVPLRMECQVTSDPLPRWPTDPRLEQSLSALRQSNAIFLRINPPSK